MRTIRKAKLADAPVRLPDVVTDLRGYAVIAFRMPSKIRNNARSEVATKVVVDVRFPGTGRIPRAEANHDIQVRVLPL